MITVGMNYKVRPGKGELFESVFDKVLKVMTDMTGHQRSHLYQDTKDRDSYLIISEWNDRQAFDAFIASERFRNVANWGKEEILAGRPTHEVYESAPAATQPASPSHGGAAGSGCPMRHG